VVLFSWPRFQLCLSHPSRIPLLSCRCCTLWPLHSFTGSSCFLPSFSTRLFCGKTVSYFWDFGLPWDCPSSTPAIPPPELLFFFFFSSLGVFGLCLCSWIFFCRGLFSHCYFSGAPVSACVMRRVPSSPFLTCLVGPGHFFFQFPTSLRYLFFKQPLFSPPHKFSLFSIFFQFFRNGI